MHQVTLGFMQAPQLAMSLSAKNSQPAKEDFNGNMSQELNLQCILHNKIHLVTVRFG